MTENATAYPEELTDTERLLQSHYLEIAFQGLLANIHELRKDSVPFSKIREQSDAVQRYIRQNWPEGMELKIHLPEDAVVFDHELHALNDDISVFPAADAFNGIDNVGVNFYNRRTSQRVRFSDAAAADFKFFDPTLQSWSSRE